MALTAGQRLGVYEVIGPIGAGGMGEVYRARDTRLGREIALKILPEMFASDPERLARFEREAQLLAALNHPHIASLHGFEESSGLHALVMELVDGATLAERIADQPMPFDEALTIARQIADALEAAHEQGIIHRDLKPANIKVTSAGSVKVLDFGLAKLNDSNASHAPNVLPATNSPTVVSPAMTTVGVLLGTASYMAPEQARGRATDRRADIWAFGCVLFEMLSGQQAFPGSDVTEVLAAVLKSEPDWKALPASTPPRVRTVLERCLHKDSKLRFRDIGDVRFALDGAFETVVVPPVPTPMPPPRRSVLWPVGLVAVALVASGLTWFISRPLVQPITPTRFSLVLASGDRLPIATGTMVAISPDGKTLAYRSTRDVMRLFVRRIDQFEAAVVGEANAGDAPFFSPDGRWIAYAIANTLKKVPVEGGPSETITTTPDAPRGGDWSPEGTIVVAGVSLITVPAAGGAATELAKAPAGRRFWYPQFISQGRAILVTTSAARPDAGDIEVFDIASKTSRKLLPGANARLLPSGHLIFARGAAIWAVRFDEDSLQVQGSPVPVIEGIRVENGGAVNYAVARDGTLIYVPVTVNDALELVWVTRDGKEESLGVPRRPFFLARLDSTGRNVALEVRDEDSDVWVLSVGRQTPTKVTFEPGEDIQPTWTPDGRLVYVSNRADPGAQGTTSPGGLFWQAADGTGAAQRIAPDSRRIDQPSVTPDGQSIVGRMADDIVLVDFNGKGDVRKLIEGPFRERNPMVSRNGRWIAYQSDESGVSEVYVRPFPDASKGRWQASEQGGTRPLWAHNGKELFYLAGDQSLMSVSFTESGGAFVPAAPRKILTMPSGVVGGGARAFDVAPGDQRFITLKGENAAERAEIRVVQHWIEELKKKVPAK